MHTGAHPRGRNPGPFEMAEKKLNMTRPLETRNVTRDTTPPKLSFGGHHISEQ